MIVGLHHVAILCSKRERSLRFYEALGFKVYETHIRPERRDEVIFMKQADEESVGMILELFIAEDHPRRVTSPEAYGLRHLALRVLDAEAMRQSLLSSGYEPEPIRMDTFNGQKLFFVKDPDGLPIELHE